MRGSFWHSVREGRTAIALRLLAVVVGAAAAVWPWAALAPRLEPPLPARLVMTATLDAKLSTLANGLHSEIVLCLEGTALGDTAVAVTFSMPEPRASSSRGSESLPCQRGTLAVWHNHPPTNSDQSAGAALPRSSALGDPSHARALCVLSERDVQTGSDLDFPFVVVSVDADTWCWWTRAQLREYARRGLSRGRPVGGQASWEIRF